MNAEQIIARALGGADYANWVDDAKHVAADLREAGIDLDHTYEQIGWCDRRRYDPGVFRSVLVGGPDESWTERDARTFTERTYFRRPLGEDQ